MKSEITGTDPEQGIGVEVYDNDRNRHWFAITWDGDIRGHEQEAYPLDREERTVAEETVMQQAKRKAIYTAQKEEGVDGLSARWDPERLADTITAVETFEQASFAEKFGDYYVELQEPRIDVTLDELDWVHKALEVDFDVTPPELRRVSNPFYSVTRNGEPGMEGGEYPPWMDVQLCHYPVEIEWEFGDGERFREFVVHHLKCQVRDAYYNMGDEPPAEFDVEGWGKLMFVGQHFVFDSRDPVFSENDPEDVVLI